MQSILQDSPLHLCGELWMLWAIYWFISARFVQKTKQSEGKFLRLQHLVPLVIGLLLIFQGAWFRFLFMGFFTKNLSVAFVGLFLTLVGLAYSVWARIHLGRNWSGIITLKEGHRLIRSGPYRLSRHPIYTGFLLAVFGSALAAGTVAAMVGVVLIVIAFVIKMRREETVLTKEFGQEYLDFQKQVKALIPFVW